MNFLHLNLRNQRNQILFQYLKDKKKKERRELRKRVKIHPFHLPWIRACHGYHSPQLTFSFPRNTAYMCDLNLLFLHKRIHRKFNSPFFISLIAPFAQICCSICFYVSCISKILNIVKYIDYNRKCSLGMTGRYFVHNKEFFLHGTNKENCGINLPMCLMFCCVIFENFVQSELLLKEYSRIIPS